MISKKSQKYQVKKSERYNDDFAVSSNLQSNATSLEDDLNALRTQIKKITGRDNWYEDPNYPSRTDLSYLFNNSQKTWYKIYDVNSDFITPDIRKEILTISGGHGVETEIVGKDIFLKHIAKYYSFYKNSLTSVSPASSSDTLYIVGGASANIEVSAYEEGGSKKIEFDYVGSGRQDLWYKIIDENSDEITVQAVADTLEVVGENSVTASISSKTLTVGYVQDVSTTATPTFSDLKIQSLNDYGVIFTDSDKYITNNPEKLFWDNTNKRLGIRTNSPTKTLEIEGGRIKHYFDGEISQISDLSDSNFADSNFIKYNKGFIYFTTDNYKFYSVNVISDETSPTIADNISVTPTFSSNNKKGFDICGVYAYIATAAYIDVVDISDPYSLVKKTSLYLAPSLQNCILYGDVLICLVSNHNTDQGSHLYIVDISDPENPYILYSDSDLTDYNRSLTLDIYNNNLIMSSAGKVGVFDLSDIRTDLGFSSRLISEYEFSFGTLGPNSSTLLGSDIYFSHNTRNIVCFNIAGDIDLVFEYDFSEVSGTYFKIIGAYKDIIYLLKSGEIKTIQRDGDTAFDSLATYTDGAGEDPICATINGNKMYVLFNRTATDSTLEILQLSSDEFFSLSSGALEAVRISTNSLYCYKDVNLSDSLNVGYGGVYVDSGRGISCDGNFTTRSNMGVGVGNPRANLHMADGIVKGIPDSTGTNLTLDIIPYDVISFYIERNMLYALCEDEDKIYIFDTSRNNYTNEIDHINVSGSSFQANIVVDGYNIFYAKNSNTFGVTRKKIRDNNGGGDSYSLNLGSGVDIVKIFIDCKYAYVASNGTSGSTLYVIDISDIENMSVISSWSGAGSGAPTNAIRVRHLYKNGNNIILYGDSSYFTNIIYSINISDIDNISTNYSSFNSLYPQIISGYNFNNEVYLCRTTSIERKIYSYNTPTEEQSELLTVTEPIYDFVRVSNKIYYLTETKLSSFDIDTFSSLVNNFDPITICDAGEKALSFKINGEDIFILTDANNINRLNIYSYSSSINKIENLSTTNLNVYKTVKSNRIHTNKAVFSNFLNDTSEFGINSYGDIGVLGKLSIISDEPDENFNVLLNGKNFRHRSGSLYKNQSSSISEINRNIKQVKQNKGFLFFITETSEGQNRLVSLSINRSSNFYSSGYIDLGPTTTSSVVCFDFTGFYCCVFFDDGTMSIVEVSHPSGMSLILDRYTINSGVSALDCVAVGSFVYVSYVGEKLYSVDISNTTTPTTTSLSSIGFDGNFLTQVESRIFYISSNGNYSEINISDNSIVQISSGDFAVTPISVKSYGQFVHILYNESSLTKILTYRANDGISSTLSNSDNEISTPRGFSVFENGYCIITNSKIHVINTENYGFSGNLINREEYNLVSGSSSYPVFIENFKNKIYYITTSNYSLYSAEIGGLRAASIQIDNLSTFNFYTERLSTWGHANCHGLTVGPGGLYVGSTKGIKIDGNFVSTGRVFFGGKKISESFYVDKGDFSIIKNSNFKDNIHFYTLENYNNIKICKNKIINIKEDNNIQIIEFSNDYEFIDKKDVKINEENIKIIDFILENYQIVLLCESYNESFLLKYNILENSFSKRLELKNLTYRNIFDTKNGLLIVSDCNENYLLKDSRIEKYNENKFPIYYKDSKQLLHHNEGIIVTEQIKDKTVIYNIKDDNEIELFSIFSPEVICRVDGNILFVYSESEIMIYNIQKNGNSIQYLGNYNISDKILDFNVYKDKLITITDKGFVKYISIGQIKLHILEAKKITNASNLISNNLIIEDNKNLILEVNLIGSNSIVDSSLNVLDRFIANKIRLQNCYLESVILDDAIIVDKALIPYLRVEELNAENIDNDVRLYTELLSTSLLSSKIINSKEYSTDICYLKNLDIDSLESKNYSQDIDIEGDLITSDKTILESLIVEGDIEIENDSYFNNIKSGGKLEVKGEVVSSNYKGQIFLFAKNAKDRQIENKNIISHISKKLKTEYGIDIKENKIEIYKKGLYKLEVSLNFNCNNIFDIIIKNNGISIIEKKLRDSDRFNFETFLNIEDESLLEIIFTTDCKDIVKNNIILKKESFIKIRKLS